MSWLQSLEVRDYAFHRNGICGVGFHTLAFEWVERPNGQTRRGIATVSTRDLQAYQKKDKMHSPETRILVLSWSGGVDINETMRGDNFYELLCKWLVENDK